MRQYTLDGVLMDEDQIGTVHTDGTMQRPGVGIGGGLSKRECDVLYCLQKGLSNKEIALMLDISPRTVQKHLQRVYQYLGVESRLEAIVMTQRLVSS